MLTIYNPIGTSFVCGFQLSNKKEFILYLFEISLVNPLTLTIVLYLFKSLQQYHISKLSSTPFLLLFISLFVIYTVNFPVVRPRSCRVIYYFDTPTLGIRHQTLWSCQVFGVVVGEVNYCINYIFYFIVFSFLFFYLTFVSFVLFFLFFFFSSFYSLPTRAWEFSHVH